MDQSPGNLEAPKASSMDVTGSGLEGLAVRILGFTRLDLGLLALAGLALIPVYWRSGLPFRIDFVTIAAAYWIATAAEAISLALLLYVIALPLNETLLPLVERLRTNRALLLMAVLLAVCLSLMMGPAIGMMLTVDAMAIAELMHRRGARFEEALGDALWPAGYLFCVIVMLNSYNHALVGMRYGRTYYGVFSRLDTEILGIQTSNIAHWGQTHLPEWLYSLLQWGYFGLYGRIGAVLAITALLAGRREAVKMVRALLIGYAIAVILFALVPVKGPYLTCTKLESGHALSVPVYRTQHALVDKMQDLYADRTTCESGTIDLLDYYIGFPSMHAALPLIALWFVRRWRRMMLCLLAVYVVLLAPSTILLEWHYAIDLLGGFAVAILSVTASEALDVVLVRGAVAAEPMEAVSCEA